MKTWSRGDAVASNLALLCCVRALAVSMGFVVPVFVSFFEGHGFSLGDVIRLEILFQATWLLLDVPTGYAADVWGRKRMMCAGSLLLLAGAIVYAFARTIEGFICCEILLAAGHACVSGADQALMRSTLENAGRSHEFTRFWGYAQVAEMAAGIVCCLIGGLLFLVDPRLPFVAAGAAFTVLAYICFNLDETGHTGSAQATAHLAQLSSVVGMCVRERKLRWLILFQGAIVMMLLCELWLKAKYLEQNGIALANNGWIFALLALCASLVGFSAAHGGGSRQLPMSVTISAVLTVAFALIPLATGWWCLISLVLLQVGRGLMRVNVSGSIKEEVGQTFHSTATSVAGAVARACFILVALVLQAVVDVWDVRTSFLLVGTVLTLTLLTLLILHPWTSAEDG